MPRPSGAALRLTAALLYVAAVAFANPAAARDLSPAEIESLEAMRGEDLRKLVFHDAPREAVEVTFQTERGSNRSFADWAGKVLVVNIWATWCPPCREEMPSFDRLQAAMAGDDLEVLAISAERRGRLKAKNFFYEIGVTNLEVLADEDTEITRKYGVLGLPATLILDRRGREIARMLGDARWDSPEARAILERIVELTAEPEVKIEEAAAAAPPAG